MGVSKDIAFNRSDNICGKLYLIPLDRQRQYSLGLNFVEKISSPELPEAVYKWGLQQTVVD
jgi:hypothetical protein